MHVYTIMRNCILHNINKFEIQKIDYEQCMNNKMLNRKYMQAD